MCGATHSTVQAVVTDSRSGLPEFANPPVTEVALGVQFERLTGLRSLQVGLLWHGLKARFPQAQELPPLDPVTEEFGPPQPFRLDVRLHMLEGPPVPRFWFLNDEGTELIQIQQDRFVHNWRKTGEGDHYPRYEHIVTTFEKELEEFRKFLAEQQLGELSPNQCEVTYVNDIVAGLGWERYGELGEILTVWSSRYSDRFLSEPESVNLAVRYAIPAADGQPAGRLTIVVEPAHRLRDNKLTYRMTLTARGRPEGSAPEDIRRFLDPGRQWVVRGFASMTTQKNARTLGETE